MGFWKILPLFLFLFLLLGARSVCQGFLLCSGYRTGCGGSSPSQPRARQAPSRLFCCSSPRSAPHPPTLYFLPLRLGKAHMGSDAHQRPVPLRAPGTAPVWAPAQSPGDASRALPCRPRPWLSSILVGHASTALVPCARGAGKRGFTRPRRVGPGGVTGSPYSGQSGHRAMGPPAGGASVRTVALA